MKKRYDLTIYQTMWGNLMLSPNHYLRFATGDPGFCKQFRGISLSVITSNNIYNKTFLLRMWPHFQPIIKTNFLPLTNPPFNMPLRRLLEGIKNQILPAVISFSAIYKASQSTHRGPNANVDSLRYTRPDSTCSDNTL